MARDRAALRDVWPGVLALLVLQGTLVVVNPDGRAGAGYLLWSLSPIIPAGWLVWAQLRRLARADEYQRVVALEAMAIGLGVVIVLSLMGGLLDAAKVGSARQSLQVISAAGILTWIAALAIRSRNRR